jgi:5-methyltetrahydropteroyltriglutamate--homocysteine methyltransferase
VRQVVPSSRDAGMTALQREIDARRIQRFTKAVGRERVIASTDCGLGLRCHPQIAWAKLKALAEGAALVRS